MRKAALSLVGCSSSARSTRSSMTAARLRYSTNRTVSGYPNTMPMRPPTANGMSASCVPPGRPHSSNTTCRYRLPSSGLAGRHSHTAKMVLVTYRYMRKRRRRRMETEPASDVICDLQLRVRL